MIAEYSKGEFTDINIWWIWWRRPAPLAQMGNSRNKTNSLKHRWMGCPLQLSGTRRQGLSLPAAQDTHTYTPSDTHTHTQKKGHPWLTHTQWAESWRIWQGCAKHSCIHTHTQTSHTHKGHGQCNQCQLILLSRAVMRPQSVIMTLPWHTLSGHKHAHTQSRQTVSVESLFHGHLSCIWVCYRCPPLTSGLVLYKAPSTAFRHHSQARRKMCGNPPVKLNS